MPTPPTEQCDVLIDSITTSAQLTNDAAARFGGRMVVLCKFLEAALPELTAEQSKRMTPLFRKGIEDTLALTDDIVVPAPYLEAILDQTNVLLLALKGKCDS
ncbi:MAG TPA: hypothetical protein VF446_13035 [Trinickia sp.]